MEYWKPITEYPHLLVSNTGKVWTTTYNRELKPSLSNRGYLRINLSKDKTVKQAHLHRLVAEAFIPNPDNLPAIDHIDGNKLNNNADNLQWISRNDNCKKAAPYREKAFKRVICIETGKVYESKAEAGRELGISTATMSALLKGEFNSYHNLHFEYYNEKSNIEEANEKSEVLSMSDYITTRAYADMHGLPIETVRTWTKCKKIPFIKVGDSIMIERSTPIPTRRKRRTKEEMEKDAALAAVEERFYHVEIAHAYYVSVCDSSGKEVTSDFTFGSKADAEALGKRMKQEAEKRGKV